MKILKRLLIILTLMVLATGTAWSVNNGVGNECQGNSCASNGKGGKMPEMDAASGTSAIALLAGMVLMMKERKRSKRPSNLDE